MSTDTENAPTYNMSEIPEFLLRSKKPELTLKELEYQYQKLNDENHQLQLRILGVNELARLLQDRNEVVAVLKDRNKRLEMSLVRLENRCATFERQLKSQKNASMPSIKPGQSPFIPGPSPKILEGLMQENLELKKTVNSLKKKGSSGYLEAVKTTQLEEFIEQQKLEIDQLRGQINELTASTGMEDVGSVAGGGGMSLPASVTDSGPLRRQLLKMQQTMSVKDRFCTLLSQQVTELQKKLTALQHDNSEKSLSAGSEEGSSMSGKGQQETQPPKDTLVEESHQKMLLDSSKEKTAELEGEVNRLDAEKKDLQEKFEATTQLYSTLLADNAELRRELEASKSAGSHVDGGGDELSGLRSQIKELQKTMDDQVDRYSKELKSKDLELDSRRVELYEANMKFAQTDSMLMTRQGELDDMRNELRQKEGELKASKSQVYDLEEQVSTLNSYTSDLERNVQHFEIELKRASGAYYNPTSMFSMKSGGAPPIIAGGITPGMETVKDSTLPPGLKCRNAEKPVSTSSGTPQTHPPQPHVSQSHMSQEHLARQQHVQMSKPPPSLPIPPPPLVQGSRTNTRSPGPPKGHHFIGGAGATPPGSTHPGTPIRHSNTVPAPVGPQFTAGYARSTSAGPMTTHIRTMPVSTYSGTPPPRQGLPGPAGMGSWGFGAGAGGGMRHPATPGGGVARVSSAPGGPPPPIPPRSMGYGQVFGGQGQVFGGQGGQGQVFGGQGGQGQVFGGQGGQGQVFGGQGQIFGGQGGQGQVFGGPPHARPQHAQQMYHRQDPGHSYHPADTRDRNTGSTSPHPPHDYNNGGNWGAQ